jgi:hypothetical protein
MKIPTSVIAKFKLAFTPPVHEVPGFFFSRRLVGLVLPIQLEDLRLKRQRRSIWKKLFINGVIVPHYVTGARTINHPRAPGNQLDGGGGWRYRRGS